MTSHLAGNNDGTPIILSQVLVHVLQEHVQLREQGGPVRGRGPQRAARVRHQNVAREVQAGASTGVVHAILTAWVTGFEKHLSLTHV